MVRQQRRDRLGGLGTGQVHEEVVEVGPRLQAVGLGGLDQAVKQRAGFGALRTAGEEPVLSSDHRCLKPQSREYPATT